MSRFLLNVYDTLTEIALGMLFVGAAAMGYRIAGLGGSIGFLLCTFVFSVFMVGPSMMISDIRKTVARIEAQQLQHGGSGQSVPSHMQPVMSEHHNSTSSTRTTVKSESGHTKDSEGMS